MKLLHTALVFVGLLCTVSPLRAQTASPVARSVLIVANNSSLDAELQPLRYADDDGALYLQALQPYARRARLLTRLDDETQARFARLAAQVTAPTAQALEQALTELFAGLRQDAQQGLRTELLFIFVGHGSVDEQGRGYLHLADGRLTRAQLYQDIIARSPADLTHVVLDACHAFSVVAGRGSSSAPADQSAALQDLSRFLRQHDLQDHPGVGVLVASSDSRETHEWSQIQAGLFSHQLRSALSGAADVNGDGLLEYSEIAAFVDAANTRLPRRSERLRTFAWPPQQDRHAPLLDLRHGQDTRYVVLGPALAGHLYVESAAGERWVDLNKPAHQRSLLALPTDRDFYVRSGPREALVRAGADVVELHDLSHGELALAARGAAARAFEQHLFAVPFGDVYYQGFLSGHPQLLAIDDSAARLLEVVAPRSRGPALELMGSYQLSSFVVDGLDGLASGAPRLENGVRLDIGAAVTPYLLPYVALEGGYVGLTGVQARSSNRVALLLGVNARVRPWRPLQLDAGVELGYGMLFLHANAASSMDPSVGLARARVGAAVNIWDGIWLRVGAAWLAALLTLDSSEAIRQRPELSVGLGWSFGD